MEAVFIHGDYRAIDHTPVGAIAAGEVVIIDEHPYIAHRAIAAGELGALAAYGGVYDFIKDGTSGPAITAGEDVSWIEGSNLASDVTTGNVYLGRAVADAGPSDALVRVLHMPYGPIANEVS